MDIFSFTDYRELISQWIALKGEKGSRTQLAKAAGCSPSWLTRVLTGAVQFTPDQAMGAAIELNLSEIETDYFLYLVEYDRCATPILKKRIQKKMDLIKKQSRLLQSDIKPDASVSEAHTIKYYSSWVYAATHVACMIKPQSVEEVSQILCLRTQQVASILKELKQMGLIQIESGLYSSTAKNIHLPADHPVEKQIHTFWRNRTIQFFQDGLNEGLHYSAVHCLSQQDVDKIHHLLKSAILKSRAVIHDSPSEVLAVFCLDWYLL